MEKKHFVKIVRSLVRALSKMRLSSWIYFIIRKKNVLLNLFKADTFNFTMYILTILTCPLKNTSVNILHRKRSQLIVRDNRNRINCYSKRMIRSSRSQMFFKIDIVKEIAICIGKHLCWSLLLACNFAKMRLQHSSFPVNIGLFLRTAFLQSTSDDYL